LDQGFEVTQAAVFPGDVSNSFILYLSSDPATAKDLGIAIVNPQATSTTITLKLKTATGETIGNQVVLSLPPRGHTSRFVRQDFFRSELSLQSDRIGSVNISSTN